MKTNEPRDRDEPLRKLLKAWRSDAALPPRFEEAVWRRIERAECPPGAAETSGWTILTRWISTILPKPAVAASYFAVVFAIGISAGWSQAREETERVKGELAERYVRVLDPYQTPLQ